MIILTLDTKKCMSSLLLSEAFDHFFFIEGEITTFGKFTMDGYMQKDFFEEPRSSPTPSGRTSDPTAFLS